MTMFEEKKFPCTARRRYRARRLLLHPSRKSRGEELAIQGKMLHHALNQLMLSREAETKAATAIREFQTKAVQAQADLVNFRKRVNREKEDIRKFAAQPLLESLLPALDAYEQALATLSQEHNVETLSQGVEAIYQLLGKALDDQNITRLTPVGETFDPNLHEALAMVKTDEQEPNTIIDVIQSGYQLGERLIRPARVRIATKPDAK